MDEINKAVDNLAEAAKLILGGIGKVIDIFPSLGESKKTEKDDPDYEETDKDNN